MLPETTPERTWLIEQYLAGNLTDEQHRRVDERRQTDPAFAQHVLAQWLVQQYMAQEQHTATFEHEMAELTTELSRQKIRYTTTRRTRALWYVLVPSLAAACFALVLWWGSRPPVGQFGDLDVENTQGLGAETLPVVVARYDHQPGWLGVWRTEGRYRWPVDTLFLYGKPWQQTPITSWKLTRLDGQGNHTLQVGTRTYKLLRGQTELTTPAFK